MQTSMQADKKPTQTNEHQMLHVKTTSVLVAAECTKFGTQVKHLHGGLHGTFTDLHVCTVSE